MSDRPPTEAREDYSRTRVPEDRTVPGVEIALIIIGFFIALPAFLAGSQIVSEAGLARGVLAIAVGSLILTVIGCFLAVVGARSRLSTYMVIQFPFGVVGARVVSLVIGASLLGWFGVNAALFGQAMEIALAQIFSYQANITLLIVFGSVLVVWTGIVGFRAIDRLARLSVPLLGAALIAILYYGTRGTSFAELAARGGGTMSTGLAISAVVGAFMVGLTLVPDVCRFARSPAAGVGAVAAGMGIAYPAVLLSAAIPSVAMGQPDFLLVMTGIGMGITAVLIVVFATWTTNISNLYSASLLLTTVFTKIPRWKLTIAAGIIGTGVAAAGIIDNFVSFLVVLSATIPPVAGIYIADFFISWRGSYPVDEIDHLPPFRWHAFAAWIVASSIGLVTTFERVTLTSIPAIDSFLAALVVYVLLERVVPTRGRAERRVSG